MQITYKKKFIRNLGNYENVTFELEVIDTVDFERGETYDIVYERLNRLISKSLNEENKKINEKLKKN